ncbi:MAG: hypothetical protein ACRBB6_09120 [Neptuniibacter sp.]
MKSKKRGSFQSGIQYLTLIMVLIFSAQLHAKTFFMDEPEEPPSSYFSNDDIRSEKITDEDIKPAKDFGRKHRLVTDYLNSPSDPVAADAKWDSEKILQVGVIRRSYGDLDYAGHICRLIIASKLKPWGITVRIIYLPSLIAFDRLEMLVEHQCA